MEAAAQASVMAAPVHAVTSDILPYLRMLDCPFELPCFRLASQAAAIRTHLRHPKLVSMLDSIWRAGDDDDAMLAPYADKWPAQNVLSHMRWARNQVNGLPGAVRGASSLEVALYSNLRAADGEGRVCDWMSRRLARVTGEAMYPGAVALFRRRVSLVFESLPGCVGMAVLRIAANAWLTRRRFGLGVGACLFGACPRMQSWIAAVAVRPPVWHLGGDMRCVLYLIPLAEEHTLRGAVWVLSRLLDPFCGAPWEAASR